MVILKAEPPLGDTLEVGRAKAAELAHRLDCCISFDFNGQFQCVGPQDHKPNETPTNKPKFRYDTLGGELWSDCVIRHVSALTQRSNESGYFICESISPTAAKSIARAFGGVFIGTDPFTETF